MSQIKHRITAEFYLSDDEIPMIGEEMRIQIEDTEWGRVEFRIPSEAPALTRLRNGLRERLQTRIKMLGGTERESAEWDGSLTDEAPE